MVIVTAIKSDGTRVNRSFDTESEAEEFAVTLRTKGYKVEFIVR